MLTSDIRTILTNIDSYLQAPLGDNDVWKASSLIMRIREQLTEALLMEDVRELHKENGR